MKKNIKNNKLRINHTKQESKKIIREDEKKQCFCDKVFSLFYWVLFIAIFLFSINLLVCKINNIEIGSVKIKLLLAVLLIYFSLFFLLTRKDYGKNVFNFILRSSSVILLLTLATLFINISLIMNNIFFYCFLLLLFTFLWIIINKSSDFKIVKFGNSIIAVVLAMFLYINGFIWTILRMKGIFQKLDFVIKSVQMTYEQLVIIILFPLFFMTSICGLYFSYRSFTLEQKEKN